MSVGEKSLAAVEYQWHKVKGTLLRSRRALRGWRKEVPPKSRLPLPRVVAFGIAMRMLSLQLRAMALLVLVSFDVYLRPGEGLTLKGKKLVRPVRGSGKQFQNYVVVVRDEDDKVPDKTGVCNNSLPLDHPSTTRWLGQALEKFKTGKRERSPFQRQRGQVSQSRRSSRRLAGLARAAHLPAEAWRSCGRLAHQDSGVRRCEGQREVANGRLCLEVRQSGQGADSVEQNAKVGSGPLPEVGSSNGGGAKGSQKPSQPVSPLWQDWRLAPENTCLEIFAGCGRLTVALRKTGLASYCLDILLNSGDDVLQPEVEAELVSLLKQRRFSFVRLGMPCTTFSIARKNDGIGPPPLRSNSCPMGLSGLKAHDRRKLHKGNLLLYFTCRIMCLCELYKIPYVLENPWSSRCWQIPIMKQFLTGGRCKLVELHFCQFGERWRKPTGLLCYGIDLSSLGRCCKGSFTSCSATGKPHIPLHGRSQNGRFMTLIAQPYPFKLVNDLAAVVSQQLFRSTLCG